MDSLWKGTIQICLPHLAPLVEVFGLFWPVPILKKILLFRPLVANSKQNFHYFFEILRFVLVIEAKKIYRSMLLPLFSYFLGAYGQLAMTH